MQFFCCFVRLTKTWHHAVEFITGPHNARGYLGAYTEQICQQTQFFADLRFALIRELTARLLST